MCQHILVVRHVWSRRWLAMAAVLGAGLFSPLRSQGQQLTFLNSASGLSNTNAVAVGPDGSVYVDTPGENPYPDDIFSPTLNLLTGFFGGINSNQEPYIGSPYGLAVTSSKIYVSDPGYKQIDAFDSFGDYLGAFGSSGTGNGQFQFPAGIAINSSLGYIYVADFSENRIQAFNSSGVYQFQFGQGILNTPVGMALNSNGNLYVVDGNNNRIDIFSSSGSFLSSFGSLGSGPGQFHTPTGIAISSTGMIYVADANNDRVDIFNSSNVFEGSISTAGARSLSVPYGIAVAPTGMVYVAEQVPGYLDRFFDPGSWISGTNSFTDSTVGPTSVNVGAGKLLGASLTLNSPMGLVVGNTLTVDSSGVLTLAGGALSTSTLEVAGSFNYQTGSITASTILIDSTGTFTQSGSSISTPGVEVAGTYNLRGGSFSAATLTVDAGGVFVDEQGLPLPISTQVNVSGELNLDGGAILTTPAVYVQAGGVLAAGVTTVSTSAINIAKGGEVQLTNPVSSRLQTPVINNDGLIDGSGRITGTLTNNFDGEVSVATAQTLVISGAGNTNAGLISLSGGVIHFTQDLNNQSTGAIEGFGTLRVDGVLTNDGTLALAGSAGVFGFVANNADGVIHLSGTQPNVFFGVVNNNGAINIDAGASGTFYGAVTGTGTITNAGAAQFDANSSASTVFGTGSTILASTVTLNANSFAQGGLILQLGGDTAGSYSKLEVTGALNLAGKLTVSLVNNFAPALGNSFDLMDWGTLSGHFGSVSLPALSAGLAWNSSQLYTTGKLEVVSVNLLPGDFNRDGHVDAADILPAMKARTDPVGYEAQYSVSAATLQAIGDVNGDTQFTNADLQSLLIYLKDGGGSISPVPEPASWALAFLALAMVSGTRFCVRCVR
jgi:hypothetical protein